MDNKKRKILIAVIGVLGVVAIVSGVTYAWFTYSRSGVKENTITAGSVEFLYTEGTNQLKMSDAMPMTDAQGKANTDFFDFKVASKTGSSFSVPYTVTVRVKDEADPENQLDPSVVKVWLSDQTNAELTDGLGVKYFQDSNPAGRQATDFLAMYEDAAMNPIVSGTTRKYNERVIYSGLVPANSSNYIQNFRLRMWIDENTNFAPTETVTPAACSDTNQTTEEACIQAAGTCDNTAYNTYADCTGNGGKWSSNNTWTPARTTQTYPFNNKTLTLIVNVYANGQVVSQTFNASEVSYSAPAGITTGCTGNNATVECALGELNTLLGS